MSYDIEEENKVIKTLPKRRKLFWALVIGIFIIVIIVWLSFFNDTIFNISTNESGSFVRRIGQYWGQVKTSFSEKINQLNSTSTDTSTEIESTSTQ